MGLCKKCNHKNMSIAKFCLRCGYEIDQNNEPMLDNLSRNTSNDKAGDGNTMVEKSASSAIPPKYWIIIGLVLFLGLIKLGGSAFSSDKEDQLIGTWKAVNWSGQYEITFRKNDVKVIMSIGNIFLGDNTYDAKYSIQEETIEVENVGNFTIENSDKIILNSNSPVIFRRK